MAIFHLSFKILTRTTKTGKSKSSLYLAAYNAREKLKDEMTGQSFDYTKKNDLYKSGIILPDGAPTEFYDRSTLWNAAEKKEKRKDSQICRYFIVALPSELDGVKNEDLLKKYIKNNFTKRGMVADYSIHDEKGKPHAHVMLSMRRVNEKGFDNKKAREWNDPKLAEVWRRQWSVLVNKTLREEGHKNTITHLSFLRQKELAIAKANEALENNDIKKAEDLISLAKKLANKKPVKRKPTVKFLKDKARKKNINPELRQRLRQQKEQKEETNKKESKLNLIFKNLILRFKGSKKTETTKMTEADFFKNMKTDEEEAENLELNKYINKELENELNQKNDITHTPTRDRVRNRTQKSYKS
ncbi:MobA/MobL family protein [Klebsiella pneumoniae]|nr:MobA/MobL family protein [Klebsiella pneumoniae]MCP5773497.1 MobA/MobL family protein [Klebsiella pneumoniae]MCP5853689.1 MobA/MobL family protein [Klebsiella pneumoniae]